MYKNIKNKILAIDKKLNDLDHTLCSLYIEGNPYEYEDEISKLENEYNRLMEKRKILSDKFLKANL
jgi:hypothetical protein